MKSDGKTTPKDFEADKWMCCGEKKVSVHETSPGSGVMVGGVHFCSKKNDKEIETIAVNTTAKIMYHLDLATASKTQLEVIVLEALRTATEERDARIRELEKPLTFIVNHCSKDYVHETERPEFNAMMESIWRMSNEALNKGARDEKTS